MFLVTIMNTSAQVSVGGIKAKLELNWANGMLGAMPVFETEEEANAYAKGRGEVIPVGEKK